MSCLNDQDKQKSSWWHQNLDQFELLYKLNRIEWYKLTGRLSGQVTRFTKHEKQARSSRRWSRDVLCSFSPCASSNLRLTLPYQEPMRAGPTYCLYLLPYTTIPTPTAIEFLLASPHALAVGHTLVSQALSSPILSSHSLGERFVSPQMHCPLSHYILELFFISLAPFFWLTFCLAPVSYAAHPSLTVSPQFLLLLLCFSQFRPILLA